YQLLAQSTLPAETNVANAIARMQHIPNVIAAARANLRNPPRVLTETAIRQNQGAIGFFEKGMLQFVDNSWRTAELKAAGEKAAASLRDYQKFLEEDLLPRSNGD